MPDNMNGRELAEQLWAERPRLKVIFTSGYSADIVGKDFKLEPELNFLQKPYQPQMLALVVRRCLDDKRPDRTASRAALPTFLRAHPSLKLSA